MEILQSWRSHWTTWSNRWATLWPHPWEPQGSWLRDGWPGRWSVMMGLSHPWGRGTDSRSPRNGGTEESKIVLKMFLVWIQMLYKKLLSKQKLKIINRVKFMIKICLNTTKFYFYFITKSLKILHNSGNVMYYLTVPLSAFEILSTLGSLYRAAK